ncbi:MAG: helix-turn-helix domain-containing protein [Candidatus Omnitrophica bacterium]|nr:helix-turn-helix domain-containing protein [Candidatus Omnitrophota bacterium]
MPEPTSGNGDLNITAWLSVHEVAQRLGLTEERVRQLIRAKQLRATKIGGWLVKPADIEAFIQSRSNA